MLGRFSLYGAIKMPFVHDLKDFPIVRFDAASIYEGYGDRWCDEMDELLARNQPFVLIYLAIGDESDADRFKRGAWLKRNKDAMALNLLALIHVEPNEEKRQKLQTMLPKLVVAFGTPQAARASVSEAEALARQLLAGDALCEATPAA
ncbi:GntR family transcriptional regulator [Cupriavidus metallidurans]|uniref:GntR family transcriptional regulator n=2 Tax=Cupriavidus metallidurans TaxID=119219 RepID=A0A482J3Y0_9BURK|nr:GntR family transcriptional regulator [Cupriavidus metallidurans]